MNLKKKSSQGQAQDPTQNQAQDQAAAKENLLTEINQLQTDIKKLSKEQEKIANQIKKLASEANDPRNATKMKLIDQEKDKAN